MLGLMLAGTFSTTAPPRSTERSITVACVTTPFAVR